MRYLLMATVALFLASCTQTVYVDAQGNPVPKVRRPTRLVIDASTGCVLNVFGATADSETYTQRFRRDGKPDCPDVK